MKYQRLVYIKAKMPTPIFFQILLYKLTNNDTYKADVEQTFVDWFPGGELPYSPGGMAYRLQWGALRYTGELGAQILEYQMAILC